MSDWITARGERHRLDPDTGSMTSMGTVCRIRFGQGEPTFPVLDGIPATLAPVCTTCGHGGTAPELITDQRHGLHTGTVTRYVATVTKSGKTRHGAPSDNPADVLCGNTKAGLIVTGANDEPVTYAPTDDTSVMDDNGERVRWCTLCLSEYGKVFKSAKSPVMSDRRPENVDRFGHTPETAQRIEDVAARLGRIVPNLGITSEHTPQDKAHTLPRTALIKAGALDSPGLVHAGHRTGAGASEIVCRAGVLTAGEWSIPTGEGDDTPKLTCAACRNALFIKGPARSRQFKARILSMIDGSTGNRPVGQTWGTLWDNSQDPAKPADRFSVEIHGDRAKAATRYDRGASMGQTLAGPGGTEAKTAMWSKHTVTLEKGRNTVVITLHRDIVHMMSGVYADTSGRKLTGWDFFRKTGKLPSAIRFVMTPEMTRRLHNAPLTASEKRARERAKAVKAQERAEYARNRARSASSDVSDTVVRGDIYAGFLNRPGRVRDVAAHGR